MKRRMKRKRNILFGLTEVDKLVLVREDNDERYEEDLVELEREENDELLKDSKEREE